MCPKVASTVRKYIFKCGEAKSFLCFYNGCSIFLMPFFSSYAARNRVSVEAGHEAVLSCPNISKVPLLLVTWKMSCSSSCRFSFRRDQNKTSRENCSERITWKYSPVSDPALRIYPVNLRDEGNYICETSNSEGTFCFLSSLTVIGKTASLKN